MKLNSPKIWATALLSVPLLSFAQGSKRPNIIWIFSDDHSYQTIGAYGGALESLNPTPNIDRLADEGMRFDRCYVENSISAPSRATLLTGKMSHLHGKINNKANCKFNHDQQQFPKLLQANGYQTAMIGKIHLDGNMQGFDYWEVLPGQGVYYDPVFITEEGRNQYKERYISEVITERALNWLNEERDQDEPFMLMVHHKAPHRNWHPNAKDMHLYRDVTIPEPATLFDDYDSKSSAVADTELGISKEMNLETDLKVQGPRYTNHPQFTHRQKAFFANVPKGDDLLRWKYQTYMKDYLRCIWGVDESVGEILHWLESSGLDDNTIIMYSSDQGFYMGEHGWFDKRMMYEESFRTPLLVRWKGHIDAGSVNKDLVQNIDFAETFLDLAGVEIPKDMQGKSIVPLMKNQTPRNWRESIYYHYYEYPGAHKVRRHEGVLKGDHKLIRFYGEDVPQGEEWEFFDLANDPSEMNNAYGVKENQRTIAKLKKELKKLKKQYEVE